MCESTAQAAMEVSKVYDPSICGIVLYFAALSGPNQFPEAIGDGRSLSCAERPPRACISISAFMKKFVMLSSPLELPNDDLDLESVLARAP